MAIWTPHETTTVVKADTSQLSMAAAGGDRLRLAPAAAAGAVAAAMDADTDEPTAIGRSRYPVPVRLASGFRTPICFRFWAPSSAAMSASICFLCCHKPSSTSMRPGVATAHAKHAQFPWTSRASAAAADHVAELQPVDTGRAA